MQNDINFPTIPLAFIKFLIKYNNYIEIKKALENYAETHNCGIHETIYVFTRELFVSNLYFSLNEEIADEFLFTAISWASATEKTKKSKPKRASEIKNIKDKAYFTQLQQEAITSIVRTNSLDETKGKILLNKYLIFFYELSTIKKIP